MTHSELSELYEANYKRMIKAVGTYEHKRYVKIERELERKSIAMLKKEGYINRNPCPIASGRLCKECTGRYKSKEHTAPGGKKYNKLIMSDKGEKCNLK